MNYLQKYNPIGDVDMIRILERLDADIPMEQILDELPKENREEVSQLLDIITMLDDTRDTIVPPREHLQKILSLLDSPQFAIAKQEQFAVLSKSQKNPYYTFGDRIPKILGVFSMHRYAYSASIAAVILIIAVNGGLFTRSLLGNEAVTFELKNENVSDTFPDDTVVLPIDTSVMPNPTPSGSAHAFESLVADEQLTVTPTQKIEPPAGKSTVKKEMSAPVPTASRSVELFPNVLETTLSPLVQNEQFDAYGVFPEDDFSIYLETPADIPIDHI